MTEDRWLSCEDPRKLVAWMRGKASQRKLRLFACAFWRAWWLNRGGDEDTTEEQTLIAFAERWAEDGACPTAARLQGYGFRWHPLVARDAFDAAGWTIRQTAGKQSRLDCRRYDNRDTLRAIELQVTLLREVFGNPYRTAHLTPWLPSVVVGVARATYEDGAFDLCPILADAMEDGGCYDSDLLAHLRAPQQHQRGCWALDLILGKE